MVLPAFLRPARIDVFLRQLCRGLAPLDGDGIELDEDIVLASVALNRYGDKGGVDDLPAFEFDAKVGQRLVQAFKQRIGELVFLERFAERPYGAGIGYVSGKAKPQKAHEGEPVADLVLQPFVGQVVQALQYEQLAPRDTAPAGHKHEHAANRLAPGGVLAFFGVDAFQQGAEDFPLDDGVEPFQRIARFTQTGV